MNNTETPITIETAARIFRVMNGQNHDDDRAIVTIDEVQEYNHAETFEGFLKVNQLHAYEEILK